MPNPNLTEKDYVMMFGSEEDKQKYLEKEKKWKEIIESIPVMSDDELMKRFVIK